MTRKDYEIIAAAIRCERAQWRSIATSADTDDAGEAFDRGVTCAIDDIIDRLSLVFAEGNPRFDRAKFIAACKV